ncbi:DCP2-domain-containing protein [Metschnikowia bicuspidata]|uniref:DCP2-domain-containing protein n=1 Tax=Metschnikowia bicuspidata TaxID=27322 RepID=A0A4P9ZDK1_9ASCO|nr:DCP2-domain-containing protein [Metschnikowia bicuspidata]
MSINLNDGLLNQPIDRVFEDILVRFVVNVPKEDLSSLERFFFQVEEAHWFYIDFVRLFNPALPSMKMKSFASRILKRCPLLWKWGDPNEALSQFGKYKSTIPVRGIALMNKALKKVVLVRGQYSSTWSFPRGKISKDEADLECAIREVREETGFDARDYVNEDDYLEKTIVGKHFRIYLAKGVPEDVNFEPLVRCEIAEIKWFSIKLLRKSMRANYNKYYVVNAIIEPLCTWIMRQKGATPDEVLMREVEARLKKLMGISSDNVPSNDAGRELLSILQGAKPHDAPASASASDHWNGPPVVPSTLSHHLHAIYANLPQYSSGCFNSILPPAKFPPPQFGGVFVQPTLALPAPVASISPTQIVLAPRNPTEQTTAPLPVTSVPLTAPKSSSAAHSKELLSILKGSTTVKSVPKPSVETAEAKIAHPASAPKRTETPPKKVTLLKRDKSSTATDPETFLSILGQKPPDLESAKPKSTEPDVRPVSSNATTFLRILNQGKKNPAPEPKQSGSSGQATPVSKTQASSKDPSRQLLNLLKRPESSSTENSSSQSASAQFLGILKRGATAKAPSNDSTIPSGTPHSQPQSALERQPDVKTEDLSAGNQILSMLNRKDTPKSVQYPTTVVPEATDFLKFQNFDDFENFEDFDDVSESQRDIYGNISSGFDIVTDERGYMDAQEFSPAAKAPASALVGVQLGRGLTKTNNTGAQLLLFLNSKEVPKQTYGAAPQTAPAPAFPLDTARASNGSQIIQLLKREKQ